MINLGSAKIVISAISTYYQRLNEFFIERDEKKWVCFG
jgi:hypothetical protein